MQTYLKGDEPKIERHYSLRRELDTLLNQEIVRSISPDGLERLAQFRNTFTWNETYEIDVECDICLYSPSTLSINVKDRNELMSYISGDKLPEIDAEEEMEDFVISDFDPTLDSVDGVRNPCVNVLHGSLKLREELDPLVSNFTNFLNGLNEDDKEIFFSSYDSKDLIRIYSKLKDEYFVSTKEDKTNV